MDRMISYLLLLGNIVLLVTGQVLFKVGLSRAGGLNWGKLVTSPAVLGGMMLYVVATVFWFIVLSRLPLSVAYPMQAFAYVLALIPAYFVFHESITPSKIVGVAVILFGVYLLARS